MKKTVLGQRLISGLNEAIAYERGEKKLRETALEVPEPAPTWTKERVARLRKERFHVSQPMFAALLSVKPATVRAWEQGLKTPSGAACRLLQIASVEPQVFQRLAKYAHH